MEEARIRRGRSFWAEVVAAYEGDGGNEQHSAFASRRGIHCDSFRRWLYKLRAEKAGRPWPRAQSKETPLRLVELQSAEIADRRFEIDLRGGTRLRVPETFDAEALRRLLGVLDAKPTL